jgi:prepilin peptidase CpaA
MGGWIEIITIKYIELSILLILALISDIKLYKIKNKIILPFIIIGIMTNLLNSGINGFRESLIGIAVPVVVLIILYAVRMLGAGDIKLFGAIGSIMGYEFCLFTIVFSFIAGGVIASILIILRKNGRRRFSHLFEYIKACIVCFTLLPYSDFDDKSDGEKFHFAVAITLGTMIHVISI